MARHFYASGDLRAAADAWRRVCDLAPRAWEPFNNLGVALLELREWGEARRAFRWAASRGGDPSILLTNLAKVDHHQGNYGDAIDSLRTCTDRYPGYAPGWTALGFALRENGRSADAARAFRRATAIAPDVTVTHALGLALLESGAPGEALASARACLARDRRNSAALAVESFARLALGDATVLEDRLDYPAIVATSRLAVPAGFADLATFNAKLAVYAAEHPTLVESASHATRGGRHSGSLLGDPDGPARPLLATLETTLAAFWESLERSPGHPLVADPPRQISFKMWCSVLERGAHQITHIHADAWLSGVYYARLPKGVRTAKGPDGCLEFGRPARPFPSRLAPPLFLLRPEEGMLVLFPSYVAHRTIPFDVAGERISVAFDVIAQE